MSKYVFVINSLLAGGAERSLLALLPALREEGVIPIVVALRVSDVGFESELIETGVDYRVLPRGGIFKQSLALRNILQGERPDLVYTSLFDADMTGRLASWGLGATVVGNLANTTYEPARLEDPNINRIKLEIVRLIDGFTARHMTDHFHAVSQAVKDSAVEHLAIDPDDITVVYRGRDATPFDRTDDRSFQDTRRSLGVPADAELVVTVGRQEYQKGHEGLISSFAGVVRSRPAAYLLIVGREGAATERTKERVETLDLEESVGFAGHRTDIPYILSASDLFVFPSLYEGLGGALIEAMAESMPIVASDLAALREVVEDGGNGLLVPPGDTVALESAISDLLGDPARRDAFARRSREIFDQKFRLEDANARLMELLRRLVG